MSLLGGPLEKSIREAIDGSLEQEHTSGKRNSWSKEEEMTGIHIVKHTLPRLDKHFNDTWKSVGIAFGEAQLPYNGQSQVRSEHWPTLSKTEHNSPAI
jgi:hypothetical protein